MEEWCECLLDALDSHSAIYRKSLLRETIVALLLPNETTKFHIETLKKTTSALAHSFRQMWMAPPFNNHFIRVDVGGAVLQDFGQDCYSF